MKLVGAMKDLGTLPVLDYSLPNLTAFYPDGAWWTPCLMEHTDHLHAEADALGLPDTLCPVRAMLGAFTRRDRFPIPDLLVCSAGATCDDFSAVVQRLYSIGHPVEWWEIPHRRPPDPGEVVVQGPDGAILPRAAVDMAAAELRRMAVLLARLSGHPLDADALRRGLRRMNRLRRALVALRETVYAADDPGLPALEMLLAEVLALHGCSDPETAVALVRELDREARSRNSRPPEPGAVRTYWVNPPADLRAMNLLEALGGCLCGADFMFAHALRPLPEDGDPFKTLACAALEDPMAGSASERARRIAGEARRFRAELVVIARVPGASHSAIEGEVIARRVHAESGAMTVEIEVPPLCEGMGGAIATRLQAAMETARAHRGRSAGRA
jgi:hypothetical protein